MVALRLFHPPALHWPRGRASSLEGRRTLGQAVMPSRDAVRTARAEAAFGSGIRTGVLGGVGWNGIEWTKSRFDSDHGFFES